jgi:hypothetical protein
VPARLLSIAEETLAEFVSKATGTAIDWVQLPGMKVVDKLTLRGFCINKWIETCLRQSLFHD